MKKIKIVPILAFALSIPLLGTLTSLEDSNVSYASSQEVSYKNTVKRYIREDREYRLSDEYQNANDAKQTIYNMSLDYARKLLDEKNSSEDQFKSAAQEIFDAKRSIEDTSDPIMDRAKLRVDLKLQLIPAKDLIYRVSKTDYNKEEYEDLTSEYARALNIYKNPDSTDDEFKEASKNLKKAREKFVKENNRKAEIVSLENSIQANKFQVKIAEDLLDNYPETVKNVSEKLRKMIKESKNLIKQAEDLIEELKK